MMSETDSQVLVIRKVKKLSNFIVNSNKEKVNNLIE